MGGGEKKDGGTTNEAGTAAANRTKENVEPYKGIGQSQDRNKPMSKRWEDYSSSEDDLGDIPKFPDSKRGGGKKFLSDEECYN